MIKTGNWDRTFLHLSSQCAEPLCFASWCYFRVISPLKPNEFDQLETKIAEVAYRVFLVLGAICAAISIVVPVVLILLGVASKVLRAVGFMFQKDNYTYVRGSALEKPLKQIMTWNICGVGGGLHYNHGGVIDWRGRLDGIVKLILSENPDVLVLQEIYDTALGEAIVEKLKDHYAHFFMHLGANVMGSVGGLMVLSKCPVQSFTNVSFRNNDWSLNRTFASLETNGTRIIGTHFIHNDAPARKKQLEQILDYLQKSPSIPTILMGDLNMERNSSGGALLAAHFEPSYTANEPTRTNHMLKTWDKKLEDPGDFIDYISAYRRSGASLQNTRLVKAYDEQFSTKTALSDHNALVAEIKSLS